MFTHIQKTNRAIILIVAVTILSFSFEGCSSVNVIAKQASKADDIQTKTVFALWWGASDAVENVDCNGNGLHDVAVKTNWLYSICTFVTLGAVVPMDIEYRCTSNPLNDGGEIGMLQEVKP